jgi:hypothetical protein
MADEKPAEKPAAPDLFTPEERAHLEQRVPETPPEAATPEPSASPDEAAAGPTPAPAPAPTPTAPPPRQDTVPQAALHEERKRRQEAEERARQIELQNARMQERWRMWQQAAAPQPTPPPEPDKDIFGAVNHLIREQQQTTAEINRYKQQIAAEQQMKALGEWGTRCEIAYRQKVPDYDKALQFLRQSRAGELKATTPWNDGQIWQQVYNEERQLVAQAAQWRQNPADMAFRNAQARGYRRDAAPPVPTAPAPNPVQRLNVIEAGQQAARSLTGVGGRAAVNPEMTVENLLKMNDRELDTFKNKYPAKYRRLKGG